MSASRTRTGSSAADSSRGKPESFARGGRPKPPLPLLGFGLIVGAAVTGFVLSRQTDFLLGQVASSIVGAFGLHGLWRGGLRKVVMLPLTVGLLIFFSARPDFADPLVQMITGKSSVLGNMFACGITMVAAYLIVGALLRLVRNRVIQRRASLTAADRFIGTTVGIAEGAALTLVLCWMSVLVEPQMRSLRDHSSTVEGSKRHMAASSMLRIVSEIDNGPLRTIVREHNVLADVPAVRSAIIQLEQAGSGQGSGSSADAANLLKGANPQQLSQISEVIRQLQKK